MADKSLKSAKLILLGESNVGKTSIITRYVENKFVENEATVGAQFFNKKITLPNGNKYLLNIWDTAGAEKYRSVNKFFYRGSSIVFLVYDISDSKSFDEIQNYWYNEILKEVGEQVIICILGNKSDLFDKEEVDENTARDYAKQVNAIFGLCSALEGSGIEQIFKEALTKLDSFLKNNKKKSIPQTIQEKNKNKNQGFELQPDRDDLQSTSKCC